MLQSYHNVHTGQITFKTIDAQEGGSALKSNELSITQIQIAGVWYINALDIVKLQKIAEELGLDSNSIINTEGKHKVLYNDSYGYLLPTVFKKRGDILKVLRLKLGQNNTLLGLLTQKSVVGYTKEARINKPAKRVIEK